MIKRNDIVQLKMIEINEKVKHEIKTIYANRFEELQMIKLHLNKENVEIESIFTKFTSINEVTNVVKQYKKSIPIIGNHDCFIMRFYVN